MSLTDKVLEKAESLFDAAGVVAEKRGVVLILGLESTPQRDLDDFGLENKRLIYRGWDLYVKPRLTALIDLLQENGFNASPVGWWGYPKQGLMHLKSIAVMGGLGLQGKNTLLLHSRFGSWLRLAALRTDAPLTSTGPGVYEHKENPLCRSCNACIDTCPVKKLLEPYRLTDPTRCLLNIESGFDVDQLGSCRMRCVTKCPVGKVSSQRLM